MGRHVRKGDLVEVIAGAHKGKRGTILEVLVKKNRVRLEGVVVVKKHVKPGRDAKRPDGGIVTIDGTVHISNVLLIDPTTDKPTRTRAKMLENGEKVRVSTRSGEVIERAAAAA